jgi:hypothetical protein
MQQLDERRPENHDGLLAAVADRLGITREEAAQADRAALQEKRRELVARREAQLGASAAAARVREHDKATSDRCMGELREKLQDIRAKLQKLANEAITADLDAAQQQEARDRAIRVIDADLAATADHQIAAFVREMWAEEAGLMKAGLVFVEMKNRYSDEVRTFSNSDAVAARLASVRGAIASAEALKIEPLDCDAVAARLEGLRASLDPLTPPAPPAGGWQETGWRPIAGMVRAAIASVAPRPRAARR